MFLQVDNLYVQILLENLAAPISFPIFDFRESAVHRGWSRVVTPLDDYGRAAPI